MYHITVSVPGLQAACTVSVRLIHLERFSIGIPGCAQSISTRHEVECEIASKHVPELMVSEPNASIIQQSNFLMSRAHIQLATRPPHCMY
jgi:hypothetical protein